MVHTLSLRKKSIMVVFEVAYRGPVGNEGGGVILEGGH